MITMNMTSCNIPGNGKDTGTCTDSGESQQEFKFLYSPPEIGTELEVEGNESTKKEGKENLMLQTGRRNIRKRLD